MFARVAALLLFVLALGLGFFAAGWMHPAETERAPATDREAAETRRLNDRIADLSTELAALRNLPAPRPAPPPVASPVKSAAPPRIDAVRLLRNQGATVTMRVFTGATTTVIPAAKTFFHLTDDEAEKISAAFERAKKSTDDGATASAAITQTADSTLTIVVPAFDGGSAIFARFAADLETALGADRGKELLEIGAEEFTSTLSSAGTGVRTVTIRRVVPTAMPNGNMTPQYVMTEPIARGMRMSQFNAPGDNGANKWLSRFEEQLNALRPPQE